MKKLLLSKKEKILIKELDSLLRFGYVQIERAKEIGNYD